MNKTKKFIENYYKHTIFLSKQIYAALQHEENKTEVCSP